jgi:hypothetical protein
MQKIQPTRWPGRRKTINVPTVEKVSAISTALR